MSLKFFGFAAIFFAASASVHAATVSPTSYEMVNGDASANGNYSWRDESYSGGSGSPSTSGALLSGGTGDLTDGIIATGNWWVAGEVSKYVGWKNVSPTITFSFGQTYAFNSATFHFAGKAASGLPPTSIIVNGNDQAVPMPSGTAPFSFVFDLTGTTTDTLATKVIASPNWLFISEITFDADVISASKQSFAPPAPVPTPAAGALLLIGLASFGALRRQKLKG